MSSMKTVIMSFTKKLNRRILQATIHMVYFQYVETLVMLVKNHIFRRMRSQMENLIFITTMVMLY